MFSKGVGGFVYYLKLYSNLWKGVSLLFVNVLVHIGDRDRLYLYYAFHHSSAVASLINV